MRSIIYEDISNRLNTRIELIVRNMQRPGDEAPDEPASHFRGTARTLGGDDAPSEVIEDPEASHSGALPPVRRLLHFWTDGFSVDDGPLHRLDDPNNAAILAQMKLGRAPLHLLNVVPGQAVDAQIMNHDEKYVAPKKKYQPFSGGGQRLGSPVPTAIQSSAPSIADSNSDSPSMSLNDQEPTISIQIRLADGSRLASPFNTSHTVGDVYDFVDRSSVNSRARAWVLMTTFPSKELANKAQILGDLPDFKRGGVVVQKWQ